MSEPSGLQLFSLGFGAVVGVGWVIAVGSWLRQAGPIGGALAFALGGLAIAVIARVYADVARRYPGSGGELHYADRGYGARAGYVAGCLLYFVYAGTVGFLAITAGAILSLLLPALGTTPVLYVIAGQPIRAGALAAGVIGLAMLAGVNLRGASTSHRFQSAVALGLITCLAAFVLGAVLHGQAGYLQPAFAGTAPGPSIAGFLAVLGTTPFWLAGFNVVTQAIDAQMSAARLRRVSGVLVACTLAGALFKGSALVATAASDARAALLESPFPLGHALERVFGAGPVGVLSVAVVFCGLMSAWNGIYFAACRVLGSLAERGWIAAPFAQRSDGGGGVSVAAVALTSGIGLAAALAGRTLVEPIVAAGGTCVSLLFALTCAVGWRDAAQTGPASHARSRRRLAASGFALSLAMLVLSLDIPGALARRSVPIAWWLLALVIASTGAFGARSALRPARR